MSVQCIKIVKFHITLKLTLSILYNCNSIVGTSAKFTKKFKVQRITFILQNGYLNNCRILVLLATNQLTQIII